MVDVQAFRAADVLARDSLLRFIRGGTLARGKLTLLRVVEGSVFSTGSL